MLRSRFLGQGAQGYFAVDGGDVVGGAVVVVDVEAGRGSLDFLYVRVESQGRGIGQQIWTLIEQMYPQVTWWETHTPYFDKRNIHFYVNRLGFTIVEFFNTHHRDPHHQGEPVGGMPDDVGQDMFRFVKIMPH